MFDFSLIEEHWTAQDILNRIKELLDDEFIICKLELLKTSLHIESSKEDLTRSDLKDMQSLLNRAIEQGFTEDVTIVYEIEYVQIGNRHLPSVHMSIRTS